MLRVVAALKWFFSWHSPHPDSHTVSSVYPQGRPNFSHGKSSRSSGHELSIDVQLDYQQLSEDWLRRDGLIAICEEWENMRTGWCFGTFLTCPYIGNNHTNWLVFFRGVETTNQRNIGRKLSELRTISLHEMWFNMIYPSNIEIWDVFKRLSFDFWICYLARG